LAAPPLVTAHVWLPLTEIAVTVVVAIACPPNASWHTSDAIATRIVGRAMIHTRTTASRKSTQPGDR